MVNPLRSMSFPGFLFTFYLSPPFPSFMEFLFATFFLAGVPRKESF